MEIQNAFVGKPEKPTPLELSSVLGATGSLWDQLVDWLAKEQDVAIQEWKSHSPKYGWSLRLKLEKRTIIYLSPSHGCFVAGFILGDRAVKAALQSALSKATIKAIKTAPRYSEGTGVRLIIKRPSDLPAIRKLALIKLAS